MRRNTFDPRINRHNNQPHEHKCEIARRLRQEKRRNKIEIAGR